MCEAGYSGQVCEISASCGGPTDSQGNCCGVGGILTRQKRCCVGVNAALARNGTCCPSGVLNACGVCDGNADAKGMVLVNTCWRPLSIGCSAFLGYSCVVLNLQLRVRTCRATPCAPL